MKILSCAFNMDTACVELESGKETVKEPAEKKKGRPKKV